MDDYSAPANAFSPEKRELLQALLKKKGIKPPELPTIPRRAEPGPSPLSFAQQRLWIHNQLAPDNPAYNEPVAIRLIGALNIPALEKSLNAIVQRHEALRTIFQVLNGRPHQVVLPSATVTLPLENLCDLPQAAREETALKRIAEEIQRPFDLTQGPLFRAHLWQLSQEKFVLLLNMHHIVTDDWSMELFFQELSTFYKYYIAGNQSVLPQLPIQYSDYAAWEQEWMADKAEETLAAQLAYWKQQLAGAPPLLDLPTDRPRPAVQTFHGASYSFPLAKSVWQGLQALSRQEGVTLFMTMLAAFKVLLHRYTGQDDILISTPVANRSQQELKKLIGFFVNTLIMRTDLSGNPTFRELLGRVHDVALKAYTHQDLPFDKLVEELRPARDMSFTPFLQVTFVLFQQPVSHALVLPGLKTEFLNIDSQTAKVDLWFSFTDEGHEVRGEFEYNTALFDKTTIERMAVQLQTLLAGIVSDPSQRIAALPLLSSAERKQLITEWNQTAVTRQPPSFVPELFEAQVERTPDHVAVVFQDQQLTYRQLNQRANQLAHHLRQFNVGPDVVVGIFAERSIEMLVSILGVLKAGGAYLPLDPNYPPERLAFMLEDARLSVLLTQSHLEDRLPATWAFVVGIDSDWEMIAGQSDKNPVHEVTAENLAYVIYTSGSTGNPKGVMVRHQGLRNLAGELARTFDVKPDDHLLQFFSFSFDASVWEIFMALLNGATLHIAVGEERTSAAALHGLLQRQAITIGTLPPSMLAVLPQDDLPALQTIVATGEASSADIVNAWASDRTFFNGYGPTETTVGATIGQCVVGEQRPSIGRPFVNTQIYLLDRHLQPVPIGIPGEIYVGGLGLARGYLNQPSQTAERFVPNPFSQQPGTRLYRTGDVARYRPDGTLDFLGRTDNQVQIRGFRVELGEIEAVLARSSEIQEAVVLAREDVPGQKRLVAYILPQPERSPAAEDLRRYLRNKLPDYMVPSIFVVLAELPLSPNGKVNRRALPAPDEVGRQAEEKYVAPRTPAEEQLAAIWADVLELDRVGVEDNFFELGGHSLLGAQIITRVHETFQVELLLHHLFEMPTIAHLCQKIADLKEREAGLQEEVLKPVSRDAYRRPHSST